MPFPGLQARTTVQPQNACPSPPQAVRRRKRPPARLRSCIAAVVYLYSCVGVPWRAKLVCGRRRVGRPAVRPRQGVRSAAPLASPRRPARPTPLRSPDRRGTAAKILDSKRERSEDAERPTAGSEKTRHNRPRANSAPGRAISPTSPTPAHNHTMHPQSTRRLAAARCRHTTAPARPRTNAGRDA